jgi:hypothetical protein
MATLAANYAYTNIDGWTGFPGDSSKSGQTFKPSVSGSLVTLKVKGGRAYGTEGGNVRAELYTHTGTYGSTGKPTGSPLAVSDNIALSSISTSGFDTSGFVELTFTFSTPYSVTAGTAYCIGLVYETNNYLLIGFDWSSPSHEGNVYYWDGAWQSFVDGDMPFEVYVQEASATAVKDLIGGFIPFPR